MRLSLSAHSSRVVGVAAAIFLTACAGSGPRGATASEAKVGPPNGTAIVVGGGSVGHEIWARFIEAAGGPDAIIIDIPTAGGAREYPSPTATTQNIRAHGARNVVQIHTVDKKVADSDSFVAIIKKAGGVWFEGGRQNLLVDAYAGTKAEKEFHNVLARGGVVAGSSAGASIQGSFLIRGASNGNTTMDAPGRNVGFGFVRNTGIDQHVVARERLPDLADSVMKKYPNLLFISEDEGTAWVIKGDNAEIIGRNKAFVYNGNDKTDEGKPFLTLRPGDKYDLARRRVTHRAISEAPFTQAWVDSVTQAGVGSSMAQLVIARDGKVLVNSSYNIPPQRRYQPTTTLPTFPLQGLSRVVLALASPNGDSVSRQMITRVTNAAGAGRTVFDTTTKTISSSVDEMWRLDFVHFGGSGANDGAPSTNTLGWTVDTFAGMRRMASFGTPDGKRNAWIRFPEKRASVILLTDGDAVDAKAVAEALAAKLLSQ